MNICCILAAAALYLFTPANPAVIHTADSEWEGVKMAARSLSEDFGRVTGENAAIGNNANVIVGTIGRSGIEKYLSRSEKKSLLGRREMYILKITKKGIVIAGSDKRGTIYGIYRLSKEIGVSPWYWWADVPVEHRDTISLKRAVMTEGEPGVQYRGIFLNDEAPALTSWVKEKFGGYNHEFYTKVFELLLRLKGNFLWPAMWDAAFYDDDPLNSYYADTMGIIMGTSHHEPCARAQKEWHRYGSGAWDFTQNKDTLEAFWRKGIRRASHTEDLITVGMRGDGDMPMSEGQNISLLGQIISEQRRIIEEETGRPAAETPQVWALYKEVQDYYDHGMDVPEDITLMFCDDNWGNVRKLPDPAGVKRSGGYGMYYHFDYVGGPRNYKWLNYNDPDRIYRQMDLCWKYGVRKIWITNVGDLKPMEFPIQLFLDMAWNPEKFSVEKCLAEFADTQFPAADLKTRNEIADIMHTYAHMAHRRTAELLNADTFSFNYDEWPRVMGEWDALEKRSEAAGSALPERYTAAYEQLVLFPVQAMTNVYRMYYAAACGRQADVEKYYSTDRELMNHYNHEISGGKWNHMMDQTHIGYRWWQEPRKDVMPTAKSIEPLPERIIAPSAAVPGPKTLLESDGYISILPGSRTGGNDRESDFRVKTVSEGSATMTVRLEPSLNFNQNAGLRYSVSIDGGPETTINFNGTYDSRLMEQWEAEAVNKTTVTCNFGKPGIHTIKFRALDDGVFLDKIIVDFGGLKDTYLGPPESPSL